MFQTRNSNYIVSSKIKNTGVCKSRAFRWTFQEVVTIATTSYHDSCRLPCLQQTTVGRGVTIFQNLYYNILQYASNVLQYISIYCCN